MVFKIVHDLQKGLIYRDFFECADAENGEHLRERRIESFFLLDDRQEHVNDRPDPNLCSDGVGRGAVEAFQTQVLLDPFEKQFHLPALAIHAGDGGSRQSKVVAQERQPPARFRIDKPDSSQPCWIVSFAVVPDQVDDLIADDSSGLVGRSGFDSSVAKVLASAGDEERASGGEAIQPGELQVSAVQHIECAAFEDQLVQTLQIAPFSCGNPQENRDVATQVQKRVELDGTLLLLVGGPGKEAKAQLDGGGVQGIDRTAQPNGHGMIRIEYAGLRDEHLRQVCPDAPVASVVGVGQSGPADRPANAHVIQGGSTGTQRADGVAEAVAKSHLRKGHAQELIVTGEAACSPVPLVAIDAPGQLVVGQVLQYLSKQRSSLVHAPEQNRAAKRAKMSRTDSNRLKPRRAGSHGSTERIPIAEKS